MQKPTQKPTLNRCVILGFDPEARDRILAEQARLAELQTKQKKQPPPRDR